MITGSPAACITRSTAFRAARGLLLSLAMAAFASAQIPSYNVIDLGTLGGPGAAARGINNGSVVAGQSAVGSHQHAFRWKEVPAIPAPGTVAVLIDLGVLPTALDGDGVNIAPSDTVVGQSNNPVIWEAVAATALPPLGGDDHGNAHAATSRTVVGYLTRYIPGWGIVNSRAVRWRGGKATELHPVDATLSQAFDINRHGHIAGWASATAFGQPHAMKWIGGAATDVHAGFAGKTFSNGFALNDSGTVVGMAFSASPAVDAVPFLSTGPGGMILLPLPVGTPRGRALDINAGGYVVGFGEPGSVALLWLPDTTPVVLQDRIPAGSGWTLRAANCINDHGEIAGWGIFTGQTRAFLLRPTTYHPGAVQTELLDPAAPEPEPNPGYPLLTDGGITTDKAKLAAFGQAAVGLVSDGTTRLVLRITTSDAGTVTVSIPGAGDEDPATGVPAQDGWLGPPGGKPDGSSVTVSTTNVGGKNMAFAVYRAPEELPPDYNGVATATMSLKVRFDGPPGTDPAINYVAIRVDRPPVVVMHGLWSNMDDAFRGFKNGVKYQINGLRVAGPNYPNAAHFADNKARGANQIDWFRGELRKEKMAMTQADVFGHSMGGLLTRLWAGERASHNRTNYNEGDINRLVTIDSLHCGAILADAIWAWRGSVGLVDENLLKRIDGWIAEIGTPPDTGALDDFRVFGPAIANITSRFTDARSHTIAGNYTIPVDLCSTAGFVAEPLFAPFFCTAKFIGFDLSANFPTSSDLLVGVDTQLGGLVAPAVDVFDHAHSGAANKQPVIDACVGLLRMRPSSSFFAQGFPFGCDAPPFTPPSGPVPTLRTSGGVLISDPPPGSSAPAGGTVAVGASGGPGSGLTAVLYSFPGTMPLTTAAPFTTTLTIPSGAYGTVKLTAFGKHSDGSISTSERTLTVTTAAALTGLTADPPDIGLFSRGHRERARIDGTFADSIIRDLTAASTGTTYLSDNTGVVTVNADGWLTPVANGTAIVTATNGTRSAAIAVTVALVPQSDLALTGPGAGLGMFAGQSAVLSLSATNLGPDPARPADVFVSGPPAVALTGATASIGVWNNSVAPAWSVTPLAIAGSAALSVNVKALTPGAGTVTASITGTGRDFTGGNNVVSVPVRVFADPQLAVEIGATGSAHFATETGVLYTLESTLDLATGIWTPVGTVAGDGTGKTLVLPPTTEPRVFYRLRLTVP